MNKSTRMLMMNANKEKSAEKGERKYRDEHGMEYRDDERYTSVRNEEMPSYERRREYRNEPYGSSDMSERDMNKVGFSLEGEMNYKEKARRNPHHDTGYYGSEDEMGRRMSDGVRGYSDGEGADHLTKEMAIEWTDGMENANGTTGPHFTLDNAKKIMAEREMEGSPVDFWVALNSMYSDYCEVAKKFGVSNLDFYVCMAKAFLDDKDSVGGGGSKKLARYYEYVVK